MKLTKEHISCKWCGNMCDVYMTLYPDIKNAEPGVSYKQIHSHQVAHGICNICDYEVRLRELYKLSLTVKNDTIATLELCEE